MFLYRWSFRHRLPRFAVLQCHSSVHEFETLSYQAAGRRRDQEACLQYPHKQKTAKASKSIEPIMALNSLNGLAACIRVWLSADY